MTGLVPLSVHVKTPRQFLNVTAQVAGVQFRSVSPGGFASAQIDLARPINLPGEELRQLSRVYITDGRTGATVWEGYLDDPGREVGGQGQRWSLTASGPSARAGDREASLFYKDTDLSRWRRVDNATPAGQDSAGASADGSTDDAINLSMPKGTALVAGSRVVVGRYDLRDAGLRVGRVAAFVKAGRADSSWRARIVTRTPDGVGTIGADLPFATASTPMNATTPTDFAAGADAAELLIRWTGGATTEPAETAWAAFTGPYVMQTRLGRDGTENPGPYDYNLLAGDVIVDLLARLVPGYDLGPRTTIAASSAPIDSLSYPDGVTAAGVLADLMTMQPGYYWAAWESDRTTGLHRFEWAPWPSVIRYQTTVEGGYRSTPATEELYNKVAVHWTDGTGRPRITRRSASSPLLNAAALVREKAISLSGSNSQADAIAAGDAFLAEHVNPLGAGTLTVDGPILDLLRGRVVQPWEIRPGYLIRVLGVAPLVGSYTEPSVARDGQTTFRITAMDYDTADNAAELTLDSAPPTVSGAIAALYR